MDLSLNYGHTEIVHTWISQWGHVDRNDIKLLNLQMGSTSLMVNMTFTFHGQCVSLKYTIKTRFQPHCFLQCVCIFGDFIIIDI